MSIFPAGAATTGRRAANASPAKLEADGVLVRPISGQIYLIEEADLQLSSDDERPSLSGLISRH